MLKLSGIAVPLGEESSCRGGVDYRDGFVVRAAAKRLGIQPGQIEYVRVVRRSVDARRKSNIHFAASVAVRLNDPALEARLIAQGIAEHRPYKPLAIPQQKGAFGPDASALAPVVVGTGPAGLFAALYLARAGLRPIVLERGESVDARAKSVAKLNETGQLNERSNIQFGEGGAGTFSDGKLTTNIKSPFASHVLQWFADAGAPEEILWQAKPHIGSDRLPAVVAAMRDEIIERGGRVVFNTQLTSVLFDEGTLAEIEYVVHEGDQDDCAQDGRAHDDRAQDGGKRAISSKAQRIPCTQLVLACGHSARDTFAMLQQAGVHLEQKPFSVGVRIEHEQAAINRAQWGSAAKHPALGAADYKMAVQGCAGRSVYTFCMCPGGEVVCAASESGGVATNGASPFARDGHFANAALLVNVVPSDFEGADRNSPDPLAGVRFQQQIEQRAYQVALDAGGAPYQLPAQTVGSFISGQQAQREQNSCKRGTVACDLRGVLPAFVCDALTEALPQFERKLQGFAADSALLLAPETRSTSPVRIARNESYQAWIEGAPRDAGCGIYPAGEGAGYAGGIMSAACDGLRVATALAAQILELD